MVKSFRQCVSAGHQGLSDFTHPNTPITIAGETVCPVCLAINFDRPLVAGDNEIHHCTICGAKLNSALADGQLNPKR